MDLDFRTVVLTATAVLLLSTSCVQDVGEGSQPAVVSTPVSSRIDLSNRTILLEAPLFRVGGSGATGPAAFGRVNGGVIDEGGRLWIADDMAGHIVVLDSDGNVTDVIGRKGQGPGEFLQVEILGWKGTEVVAYDVEQRRTVLIDMAADSSVTLPSSAPRRLDVPRHIKGMGSQGETVFIPLEQPGGGREEVGWAEFPPPRLVVENPDGKAVVVLAGPLAVETYFDGERYLRHPLQTTVDAGAHADTVVLVGTMAGDVLVSTMDGAEAYAFNMSDEPGLEVGEEAHEWIRNFLGGLPAEGRRFWLTPDQVEERRLPPRRPFYDRVVVSADGAMWLRRTGDELADVRRWDVIALGGAHLGTAHLPKGEDVVAAGPTLVGTVGRDDTNAHVVSLYAHPFRRTAEKLGGVDLRLNHTDVGLVSLLAFSPGWPL